jgi:signal transduction histidine kinase
MPDPRAPTPILPSSGTGENEDRQSLEGQPQERSRELLDRELDERGAALDAFVSFAQLSATTSDVGVLAHQAVQVLRATLGEVTVAYYEPEGEFWKGRVFSDDVPNQLRPVLDVGIPRTAPTFAEAVQTAQPLFIPGWDAEREGVAQANEYGAVAFGACFVRGEARGMLTMGLRVARDWTERERAVFRAVKSSLELALERTDQARRREQEVQEIFARFTTQMTATLSLDTLVQTASDIIRDGVADSACIYFELQGDRFMPLYFSDNVPPAVRAAQAQGTPLDRPVVAEALERRDIVFAEYEAGRGQATPEGPFTAVGATAYFRGDRVHALLGVASAAPAWTTQEKALLRSVGQGLGLAIERLEQRSVLELERETLNTFVAFTESAGELNDLRDLTARAFQTLSRLFPGSVSAFLEHQEGRWVATQVSAGAPAQLEDMLRAGLTNELPTLALLARSRQPVFLEDRRDGPRSIPNLGAFSARALYPIVNNGELVAALAVGLPDQPGWSDRERAIVSAVGRSFSLLYERIAATEALRLRQQEAESRTRALEAFAQLTTDLGVQASRSALIRRALEVIMSLLPPGYAACWVVRAGRWQVSELIGDVGSPDLMAAIDEGLPVGETPTLDIPARSREPYFQAAYVPGTDTAPGVVRHILAVACVPLIVSDVVEGIINVPLFEARHWSGVDKAVLTTVAQSLGLALERAQSVTELGQRSQELERSNAELQAANEELEAFAYSASHDLRTPVRHVKAFSELARRALGNNDAARATEHMLVVEGAAQRMTELIDAMLLLSRSTRQELSLEDVPLAELVTRARQDLEQELEGRAVEWRVSALPVVTGDRVTLQQVMTNLLANAVKFSRTREQALIEVWAEERPGTWDISVRDNGVGFDPKYQAKLFGVFQRLHNEREFEGTGVGLATVRRILARHGGRVSARSTEGQGATFTISLPRGA